MNPTLFTYHFPLGIPINQNSTISIYIHLYMYIITLNSTVGNNFCCLNTLSHRNNKHGQITMHCTRNSIQLKLVGFEEKTEYSGGDGIKILFNYGNV